MTVIVPFIFNTKLIQPFLSIFFFLPNKILLKLSFKHLPLFSAGLGTSNSSRKGYLSCWLYLHSQLLRAHIELLFYLSPFLNHSGQPLPSGKHNVMKIRQNSFYLYTKIFPLCTKWISRVLRVGIYMSPSPIPQKTLHFPKSGQEDFSVKTTFYHELVYLLLVFLGALFKWQGSKN